MISDITLGQFFPGFSLLHKLDPRTKLISAILFIVAIFLAKTPLAFLLLTVFTVVMIFVSRISFSVILRGIRPVVYILIFTSILNVFMTKGHLSYLLNTQCQHSDTYMLVKIVSMYRYWCQHHNITIIRMSSICIFG